MNISTLVISDLDRFVEMRSFWDQELKNHVSDPFFLSSMLIGLWKFGQKMEEKPFLIIFLAKGKIIGFSPFLIKTRFGFKQVHNFDQYRGPIIFSANHREECFRIMIHYVLEQLKCESIEFVIEDKSANQLVLERFCERTGLSYGKTPLEGQAMIPVEVGLDSFRESLSRKTRKKFRRMGRRLDDLGSWKICSSNVDDDSIRRIWNIEKFSWKADLEGKAQVIKDFGLYYVLKGVQTNDKGESFFESKIWFLYLDELPIAYMLTMKFNKTIVFAKTSFDSRFKHASPGVFLTNNLIERVFRDKTAEAIDFITNLPFTGIWNPAVKKKSAFRILGNPFVSKARALVFENRIGQKYAGLERFRWKRIAGSLSFFP